MAWTSCKAALADSAGVSKSPLPPARALFSGMAEAVEQSLFGGRPLDPEGFVRCREAYQAFAQAGGWA